MSDLDHESLKNSLGYNPITGEFRWKKDSVNARSGDTAGTIIHGYRMITINYRKYRAHHLAWLYIYGESPMGLLDHVNGEKDDNRISNLRLANKSQNGANMKPRIAGRLKGCYFHKLANKWAACIKKNRRSIYLGLFPTEKAAHAAYMSAARKIFGEFARGI